MTIGVISIIIGSLGFVISMRNQFKNAYLADRMLILDVVKEVHEAKVLQFEEIRARVTRHNEESPDHKILVPELLWWWAWKNWPCIPKQLNSSLVLELLPLRHERAKFIVKVCIMGVFIAFIFTVMQALGMNDRNSAFDAVRMLITVVAVIGPSFIAKLHSNEEKAICLMQKRGIVQAEVDKFLLNNKTFYNYNFDLKLKSECNRTNQDSEPEP